MKKLQFLSVFIVFLYACGEDDMVKKLTDDVGVVIATPYLWKTSLHQKEPVSNGYLKFPVMYNDNILVPVTNGEEGNFLALMNTADGKLLWKWRDLFFESE